STTAARQAAHSWTVLSRSWTVCLDRLPGPFGPNDRSHGRRPAATTDRRVLIALTIGSRDPGAMSGPSRMEAGSSCLAHGKGLRSGRLASSDGFLKLSRKQRFSVTAGWADDCRLIRVSS